MELVVYRYALAGYRCRISKLVMQMPWIDTGIESTIKSLTDMPWLDTGIESRISRLQICPGWIQVSNLEFANGW